MGRTSKLTPERQEKIIQALELGLPLEAAAGFAGVDPDTVGRWRRKGRAAKSGIYRRFCRAVDVALSKGEASLAVIVRQGAQTDAKLALSMLSRRFPARWARRVYKPDEPGTNQSIVINFTRPEVDPDEKGDDLVVVNDVDDVKPGNGNGGEK